MNAEIDATHKQSRDVVAGLSRSSCDAIESLHWAMGHFGSLMTNRQVPRRTVMKLVGLGIAESAGQCVMCDDDGFTRDPERCREGFRLTAFGEQCHADLMDRYEELMLAE